ncbi:MAG: ABC transporter permease [Planctomycetota bacterium]|nr:ABC transporter permease [Planctomycetota bacterium]
MNLAGLAARNLARTPWRSALTVLGIACAAAAVLAVLAVARGYERALRAELARTGVHLFVSTEGCPTVAATLLVRGGELPRHLSDALLAEVQALPGVRRAGGYLIATAVAPSGGLDLFFGISEEVPQLRPEWRLRGSWFSAPQAAEALLGAAVAERWQAEVGSVLRVPSLDRELRVVGILERTRSHDDQIVFLPLATAQRWFRKEGMLTAIGVQLADIARLPEVKTAIEALPDAYVVPAEAMQTEILALVNGTLSLMSAVVGIVLAVSFLGLANTLLMAALERRREFAVLRCLGASGGQLALLALGEALVIALLGLILGLGAAGFGSAALEGWLRQHLPYAPAGEILRLDLASLALTALLIAGLALATAAWPAWRVARVAPLEALRHG